MTYEATRILEQNIQAGTGTRAATGCPAAGKTGTTDRNTDAWFAGFTPRLATAVWVGYPNDRTEMHTLFYGGPVDGGTFPAAIWGVYMKSVIGKFCGDFKQPKEPFSSTPFVGEYSSTGGGSLGYDDGDGVDDSTTAPVAPAPVAPTEPTEPSRGAARETPRRAAGPSSIPSSTSPRRRVRRTPSPRPRADRLV